MQLESGVGKGFARVSVVSAKRMVVIVVVEGMMENIVDGRVVW